MAKTIMVVDDDEDVRNTTKTVLEREGYKIIPVSNAEDALKEWKSQKPDLVLMDIMMPGKSVKDVIPKMIGSKVVYLSVVRVSEAEKEDLMKSKNVVGFIQKPFDIKDLVTKVKNFIK